MAIEDPQAIQFEMEYIRPLAEHLRELQHEINNAVTEWNSVSAVFSGAQGELIADRHQTTRPATGANVVNTVTRMGSVADILNAAFAMDDVLPLCVRPFNVE